MSAPPEKQPSRLWPELLLVAAAGALLGVIGTILTTDQNPGDVSTGLITAGAAILVAGIAARTADRRLDKQLGAEADRLETKLRDERLRHSATLRHERELHDLEELRDVLDTSVDWLGRAKRSLEEIDDLWKRLTISGRD